MKITVADTETDPFKIHRIPHPFVLGYYDGERFRSYWSLQCVDQFVTDCHKVKEPEICYIHNGGKFDFFLGFIQNFQGDMRIINGRIVAAQIGNVEFRDSFALLPFPLREHNKDEIDYAKMEPEVRELHKDEILSYLRTDCVSLHELVVGFHKEFGDRLTVGSAAMKELKKFHQFKAGNATFDLKIRKRYYYGGRNQCFATGIVFGKWKIFDLNSAYPDAMMRVLHPASCGIILDTRITNDTFFVSVDGQNLGAFPKRDETDGLDFTGGFGTYHCTIHEYRAALDTGTFRTKRILKTYGMVSKISFAEFVTYFYHSRQKFKAIGDSVRSLLFKYVLNSSYGKFAQNPANYFDWKITKPGEPPPSERCEHCYGTGRCLNDNCRYCELIGLNDHDKQECKGCDGRRQKWIIDQRDITERYIIWRARSTRHTFYNVATGASITGAVRAMLLRGLAASTNPIYCDTDSIMCEALDMPLSETELGSWKLEGTGDIACIAGKKLYCLLSFTPVIDKKTGKETEKCELPDGRTCWLVKKAHKGARLTGQEIISIAAGSTVEAPNPVPHFKMSGKHGFVSRKIRTTTKNVRRFAA